MSPELFESAIKLRGLTLKSAAVQGARLVLVDGMQGNNAAKHVDVSAASISMAGRKIKETIAAAKELAALAESE